MTSVSAQQLDTRVSVITPELVAFEYELAGPARRLAAYGVDVAVRGMVMAAVVLLVLSFVVLGAGDYRAGLGPVLIVYFLVDWFYGALFEAFWSGQTPGKKLLAIRVLSTSGRPIHGEQAVVRNLLRAADVLPFLLLSGALSVLSTRRFQRLGDLAADTMVVVKSSEEREGPSDWPAGRPVDLAIALPAGFEPTRELRDALSAYVAKRGRFSERRRREIAAVLAPALIRCLRVSAARETELAADPDRVLCAVHYRFAFEDFVAHEPDADERPASTGETRAAEVHSR